MVGGDEVSKFVLSGFNSFKAMSAAPCKPYSANRDGVSLGEAAAAALVTKDSTYAKAIVAGDGSINDANHISGPSRTGEGLVRSIESAMQEAGVTSAEIDYISAHGTATPFNDEMEAIAFNRLALNNAPVNSYKGYYGHTLGASGLLETIIGLESMQHNRIYASLGYDGPGVSQPINVIAQNENAAINYWLKTASGFGGCNTAVVFKNKLMAGTYYISKYCTIQDGHIALNGEDYFSAPGAAFTDFAKQAYKHAETDYAKFLKWITLANCRSLLPIYCLLTSRITAIRHCYLPTPHRALIPI